MNTPMNANEIVGALRVCNRPKGHRCSECPIFSRYEHTACKATVDRLAAALIESQAAEIARHNAAVTAEGFADVQTMIARYKQVMYDANEISISQDEEIEELRERLTALRDAQTTHYCVNCEDVARQLAESQRRERAALKKLSVESGGGDECDDE